MRVAEWSMEEAITARNTSLQWGSLCVSMRVLTAPSDNEVCIRPTDRRRDADLRISGGTDDDATFCHFFSR